MYHEILEEEDIYHIVYLTQRGWRFLKHAGWISPMEGDMSTFSRAEAVRIQERWDGEEHV